MGLVLAAPQAVAAQRIIVAGAGPSAKVATVFFRAFEKTPEAKGLTFEIPKRSIKHAGGIAWSNSHILGRTGRPLNDRERALEKSEILLASIPVSFVKGQAVGDVPSLTKQQLVDILAAKIRNWRQVGGPDHHILLVGREKTEASLGIIKKVLPEISSTKYDLIFSRDHQVLNFIKTPRGQYALAFGSQPNFPSNNILSIAGLTFSQPVGLVFDNSNREHSLVKAVIAFSKSDEWKGIVEEHKWHIVEERK